MELSPFLGRNAPDLLDRQALRFGDKPLLIWSPAEGETKVYSYAGFADETRAYAAGLAGMGVKPGDAVIIHLDNHPALLLAWFACARIGAVAVTTNTRATRDELVYFVEHSRAVGAITSSAYAGLLKQRAANCRWIVSIDPTDLPDAQPLDTLRAPPEACPTWEATSEAPCSVMYTSGTTARPKGVVWTHANVLWAARANAAHFGLTPEDRCLVFLPLFHAVALSWNFLGTLNSGGSVVLMPRFSATRFWDVAVAHGCTWANMVGFTLQAVSGLPDPPSHRFRTWVCAGDLKAVSSRWGIRTLGAFGMTEMISQPLSSDLHHPGPEGAMGRVNPGYRVDLRREDGFPPSPGEVASLWIKGQPGVTIFQGYLHDPQATSEAFDSDGWFCTGDKVIAAPDGHAFYAGRTKDMLKVGAENVAAVEIEQVILEVAGVREAAVVGLPDRMLDEVPVAFVVIQGRPDETLAAIRARCLERLADFKRPRSLHVVDELPKGLLDKVLKRELRELAVRLAVPVNAPAESRR